MGNLIAARAPSNIALIKYMGKKEGAAPGSNLPENPSLSLTLSELCTVAEFECVSSSENSSEIKWDPELPRTLRGRKPYAGLSTQIVQSPLLDEAAIERVMRHIRRVQAAAREILPAHGLTLRESGNEGQTLVLRSANSFPAGSGIASSASSFAAITLATALTECADPEQLERAWATDLSLRRALASVSRQGSGSSCRSFEGPWVLWDDESTQTVPAQLPPLAHFVLLISSDPKAISSSAAHQRVKTSALWPARVSRVTRRLETARHALATGDLPLLARTAWSEAWEMHSLFHTSEPPFTYWKGGTIEALEWLAEILAHPQGEEIPPIVTMDAGPNIHITVPEDQAEAWRARLTYQFPSFGLLEDRPGRGAEPLLGQGAAGVRA